MRTAVLRRAAGAGALVGAMVLLVTGTPAATAAVCGPAGPLRFMTSNSDIVSLETDGTQISSVAANPDLTDLDDFASRADGLGFWALDFQTGEIDSIDAATGVRTGTGLFGPQSADGLALRPDGKLVADDRVTFYEVDPTVGGFNSLNVSLPAPYAVDGDYDVLPDGRILVAAVDTTSSNPTDSQIFLLDPSLPGSTGVQVGTLPTTWAVAIWDGDVYFGTATGDVLRHVGFPTTASTAPLTVSTVTNLAGAAVYGAAVPLPVACPAVPVAPATSSTPDPRLAQTGTDVSPSFGATVLLLLGAALILASPRGKGRHAR